MGALFKNTDRLLQMDEDDFIELKNRVYSQLGWPTVAVELSDDHFKYIVKRAIMYLNTYAPKVTTALVDVTPATSEYTLEQFEDIHAVLDIYASADYLIALGIPVSSTIGSVMGMAAAYDVTIIPDYLSMLQAYQNSRFVFQTVPRAEIIHPNTVRILPTPFMASRFQLLLTVDHDGNLASLDKFERDWLVKFCIASTNKVVGTIRRKYSGLSPFGDMSGTGSSMVTEGIENEKELLEQLNSRHKFPEFYIQVG